MTKGTRIFVLAVFILLTAAIWSGNSVEAIALGNIGVVIFSALIMMAFSILMIEHFFTKPTDVVASATSALLILLPLKSDLLRLGFWYWALVAYAALMLMLAVTALLLLSPSESPESKRNTVSKRLRNFVTTFGNAKVLWFLVFAASLFGYVDSNSSLFIWLAIASALLLIIDPRKMALGFLQDTSPKHQTLARVIGVSADDIVIAKLEPYARPPRRFDFVQVNTSPVSDKGEVGLVMDVYTLDDERWIRVLSGKEVEKMAGPIDRTPSASHSVVSLDTPQIDQLFDSYVGVVREGSNIDLLKFDYSQSAEIREGSLLQVRVSNQDVFYQVTNGLAVVEALESKNETALIVGEAIQLGTWNPDRQVFEKFGWLPNVNSPVFIASQVAEHTIPDGETRIGTLPGTSYPVSLDLEAAISHHTAILGVTGSGKSVFARDFVRKGMRAGYKVICVDFTGEYQTKLTGAAIDPIVSDESASEIMKALEYIAAEMDEWANKRNKAGIEQNEQAIGEMFGEAFESFLKGSSEVAIFSLPDVTNSSVLLDYTKWFFKILFKIAKESQCYGSRVCVVLEEAHTVIPEWNFLGVDDKRSNSLVNTIAQIALQGRKYGVGLVIVAQRTANVSKTVLTQCNTIIAFQQFDRTSGEFLSNYMGDLSKSLPRLKARSAIVVGKAFRGGLPLIFNVPDIDEPTQLERLEAGSENISV